MVAFHTSYCRSNALRVGQTYNALLLLYLSVAFQTFNITMKGRSLDMVRECQVQVTTQSYYLCDFGQELLNLGFRICEMGITFSVSYA